MDASGVRRLICVTVSERATAAAAAEFYTTQPFACSSEGVLYADNDAQERIIRKSWLDVAGVVLAQSSRAAEELIYSRRLQPPRVRFHKVLGCRNHRRDSAAVIHRECLVELGVDPDVVVCAEDEP